LHHSVNMADLPAPKTGFIATHFITVSDVKRSTRFYRDILGGTVELEGEPTYVRLANTYVVLNVGGGPTDDKPNTVLRPPENIRQTSSTTTGNGKARALNSSRNPRVMSSNTAAT
jgi:catechol 2,3-dioxygenase-like lactoylglutathione lyase family enzyme